MPNSYDGRINPESKNNIEFFTTLGKYSDGWTVATIFQSRVKEPAGVGSYFTRTRLVIALPLSWSEEDVYKFMNINFTDHRKTKLGSNEWGAPVWEWNHFEIGWLKGELGWFFIRDTDLTEEQEWIINYILYSREYDRINSSIEAGRYNLDG